MTEDPDVSGTSVQKGAEEIAEDEEEVGRVDLGEKGESERPYGESEPRAATGVDPQGPIDPESPYLPPA